MSPSDTCGMRKRVDRDVRPYRVIKLRFRVGQHARDRSEHQNESDDTGESSASYIDYIGI